MLLGAVAQSFKPVKRLRQQFPTFLLCMIVKAFFPFVNDLCHFERLPPLVTEPLVAFSYDWCNIFTVSYDMANNTFLKSVRIYFESYLHCWSRLYFCIWPES